MVNWPWSRKEKQGLSDSEVSELRQRAFDAHDRHEDALAIELVNKAIETGRFDFGFGLGALLFARAKSYLRLEMGEEGLADIREILKHETNQKMREAALNLKPFALQWTQRRRERRRPV